MGIKYTCDRCGKKVPVLYRIVIYGEDTELGKTTPIKTKKYFCEKCFNKVEQEIIDNVIG